MTSISTIARLNAFTRSYEWLRPKTQDIRTFLGSFTRLQKGQTRQWMINFATVSWFWYTTYYRIIQRHKSMQNVLSNANTGGYC